MANQAVFCELSHDATIVVGASKWPLSFPSKSAKPSGALPVNLGKGWVGKTPVVDP